MLERANIDSILLATELFPPAVGGSAELLANVYGRVSPPSVGVIAAGRHAPARCYGPTSFRVSHTRFGSRTGLFAADSLCAHLRLARDMRRRARPETIIHCGRALPEGLAALLCRYSGGPPYLCWTHGEELSYAASSREHSWLLTRVQRGAEALVANSHNTARLLRALGNPPDKVHVVHPGVDSDRFRPDVAAAPIRSAFITNGELLLLSVGRLQARKGHDLVIRALATLGADSRRFRYVIVGDGADAERLKTLVAENGLGDRVLFLGEVAADALPGFYAAADIFVHPNRMDGADFEGFGLVFLEAAASGLPAIGGRSGGVPEAIEHGVTGMLVGGDDALELRETIQLLAGSRTLREDLGRAARARVLREFTWDRAARKIDAIDATVRRQRNVPS